MLLSELDMLDGILDNGSRVSELIFQVSPDRSAQCQFLSEPYD
jgi:hypothetical protein